MLLIFVIHCKFSAISYNITDTSRSGGLGLTGGLVDAGNLFDCLNGIHQGLANDSILSRYDEVRREMYEKIINPISSENIRRLWQDPTAALKEDKFLEMCRKAETDPELSRRMQEVEIPHLVTVSKLTMNKGIESYYVRLQERVY
jgi:hypothetical protein